jgi:uncharacterized membrane protein YdfJ with MMPL/SSD domain
MSLLSIAAACGVLTLVSQGGWTRQAFGFPAKLPVTIWVPVFLFVVLFGLSTDYQVFLLARVREAYCAASGGAGGAGERAGGEAARRGLARSARVISAAGAIMIAVFLAAVPGASVPVKQVAVGLAMAILIDVALVRLVLAPAVMKILGEANWWLPGPLDRLLPATSRFGGESPATRDRQPKVAD